MNHKCHHKVIHECDSAIMQIHSKHITSCEHVFQSVLSVSIMLNPDSYIYFCCSIYRILYKEKKRKKKKKRYSWSAFQAIVDVVAMETLIMCSSGFAVTDELSGASTSSQEMVWEEHSSNYSRRLAKPQLCHH